MSETFDVCSSLEETFNEQWDKPLIVEPREDREWTYGGVLCRAAAVDEWLDENGIPRDSPIRFAPANSAHPLVVYLGGFLSGRRIHAIDPSRSEQDINEMLEMSAGSSLLTDATGLTDREDAVTFTNVDASGVSKEDAMTALRSSDPDAPFLTTYTSGTTGTPKGVVHSFGNLVRSSLRFGDRFGFDSTDTFYHTLPMGYMAGILNALVLPMVHGSTITVGPRISATNAPSFFELAERTDVNVFWLTPTILRMLTQLCSGPYNAVSSAVGCVATEPLPAELKSEFESEFDIELYETYGLSETLFITTEYPGLSNNDDGVGAPLPEVDITIQPDGEVAVSSPWLLLEYSNRQHYPVREGQFFTGDVGRFDGAELVITGRKKDLIVRNGINISPTRIEDVLEEQDAITEAAVVGQSTDEVGELVVAFLNADGEFNLKELQQTIIDRLGSDHRVDEFIEYGEFPRTGDNEIDYDALKESISV